MPILVFAVVSQLIYWSWLQHNDNSSKMHSNAVAYLKRFLHWIYLNSPKSRKELRLQVGGALAKSPLALSAAGEDLTSCSPAKIVAILYPPVPPKDDSKLESKAILSIPKMTRPGHGPGPGANGFFHHIRHLLDLLITILDGMPLPASGEAFTEENLNLRKQLLVKVLLPLHRPNEMVLWRDQVPVLQDYHEALVRCTVRAAAGHPDLLSLTIRGVLDQWPDAYNANTPKQVLLLHELETLVVLYHTALLASLKENLEKSSLSTVWVPFWVSFIYNTFFCVIFTVFQTRFSRCFGTDSDNIRPAQRALQFFKNEAFLRIFACPDDLEVKEMSFSAELFEESMRIVLPALFRGGSLSWNPTVNRMTGMAIRALQVLYA